MILIQISDSETGRSAIAEFPSEFGPSFRSMVADRANEVGERASGSHVWDKEDAITRALAAYSAFRAKVNHVIEKEDPDYE